MTRTPIRTTDAPGAIGPYSQAIVAGDWVFTAGQIGLDPAGGGLAESIEGQTVQVLKNLTAVLSEAGCGWRDVAKTTVFLKNMSDFAAFNAVYAEIVEEPFPARSTVQAAGLPADALIEIEAMARRA